MLPALARRAIETYSDPGDLVVDPMCGIATTLVEAAHLGRRAIGVEIEPRWAALARGNVEHARRQGARGRSRVICGDARSLTALDRRLRGRVDLLLSSPPYGNAILGDPCAGRGAARARACEGRRLTARDRERSRHACRAHRYGPCAGNLAGLPYGKLDSSPRRASYLSEMGDVYRACAAVLKPGGFLVVVTRQMRRGGRLRDLAADTIVLCERAGLSYWQHVIALHAPIRDNRLHPRPSLWQTLHHRRALAAGRRPCLPVHEDLLVFRRSPEPARDGREREGRRATCEGRSHRRTAAALRRAAT